MEYEVLNFLKKKNIVSFIKYIFFSNIGHLNGFFIFLGHVFWDSQVFLRQLRSYGIDPWICKLRDKGRPGDKYALLTFKTVPLAQDCLSVGAVLVGRGKKVTFMYPGLLQLLSMFHIFCKWQAYKY